LVGIGYLKPRFNGLFGKDGVFMTR